MTHNGLTVRESSHAVGVVIGKFNPPHLGHLHLIEQAAAQVQQLFVIVCDRPDQTIRAARRAAWLQADAPGNAAVMLTPDDLPELSEPWAKRVLEILPTPPSIAFTSEPWGSAWAAHMGAIHVAVDEHRNTVPISATRIRADLGGNFQWLIPAARQALARRVAVVGAESTGKSTLAEALARELRSIWVPEHGRWYWEGRRYLSDQSWTSDEFRRIASSQIRLANDLARRASTGLVIADTDALVTAVWHERYLGSSDPEIETLASSSTPDLYLVCAPDFDWVQDGTRESERHRMAMHAGILERVGRARCQAALLQGSQEGRLAKALESVRPLQAFAALL